MSLVLNTNINSMLAQNSLTSSGSQLSTALQQLSSGLRINTAADDAAGYAIVQGMTSQINGLNQAARNAGDGVSLTQTAQGALTEITNDLQTMRDLAVQSLNATNSATDRADLDQQFQQLSQDIDQVAKTASFNGVNLLDGSFQGAQFQIGANAGQTITVASVNSSRTGVLGQQYTAGVTSGALVATNNVNLAAITINGTSIGSSTVAADASSFASAINNAGISGVTATAAATSVTGATVYAANAGHAGAITINGVTTASITTVGVQATDVNLAVNAINAVSAATGVTASNVGGNLKLSNTTGANITVAYGGTLVAGDTTLAAATTTSTYSVNYSSTAGGQLIIAGTVANSGLTAATTNVALSGVSIANSAVTSVSSSNAALASVDAALQQIAATGAQLGAYQSRFQAAISGLNTDSTNLQSARSSIQDTDYAAATSALSKAQILQQASTAMVAQANTVPQNVLTLLQKLP
jgi:flagellin